MVTLATMGAVENIKSGKLKGHHHLSKHVVLNGMQHPKLKAGDVIGLSREYRSARAWRNSEPSISDDNVMFVIRHHEACLVLYTKYIEGCDWAIILHGCSIGWVRTYRFMKKIAS